MQALAEALGNLSFGRIVAQKFLGRGEFERLLSPCRLLPMINRLLFFLSG